MPKTLTATDRKSLIRLASSMEKGSEQRRAILAGLSKVASDDAWSAPGKKREWAVVFGTENGGRDYWLQAGEGEPGYGISDPQVDEYRLRFLEMQDLLLEHAKLTPEMGFALGDLIEGPHPGMGRAFVEIEPW